ncbi:hypothetical protein AAFN90_10950 [Erwiniaceae bacterium CAU 1747]
MLKYQRKKDVSVTQTPIEATRPMRRKRITDSNTAEHKVYSKNRIGCEAVDAVNSQQAECKKPRT